MFSSTDLPWNCSLLTGPRSPPVRVKAGAGDPTAGSSPTVLIAFPRRVICAMGTSLPRPSARRSVRARLPGDGRHPAPNCCAYHRMVTSDLDIYSLFRDRTMVPQQWFTTNLALARSVREVPGAIVECGVWRGGMIAGIAMTVGADRVYWLFDSFEGLPTRNPSTGRRRRGGRPIRRGRTTTTTAPPPRSRRLSRC